MSRISTAVQFPGALGAQLAARLDMPGAQAPHAYVLLAHCFTCSKDTRCARSTLFGPSMADLYFRATPAVDYAGGQ